MPHWLALLSCINLREPSLTQETGRLKKPTREWIKSVNSSCKRVKPMSPTAKRRGRGEIYSHFFFEPMFREIFRPVNVCLMQMYCRVSYTCVRLMNQPCLSEINRGAYILGCWSRNNEVSPSFLFSRELLTINAALVQHGLCLLSHKIKRPKINSVRSCWLLGLTIPLWMS